MNNLMSKPEDKPVSIKQEQIGREQKQKTIYITIGIVLFIVLFVSTQMDTESRRLETIYQSVASVLIKFVSSISKDTGQVIDSVRISKLANRHMTFFLFLVVLLCILAGIFTMPGNSCAKKGIYATENTGEPGKDTMMAIIGLVFAFGLWMIYTNYNGDRSSVPFSIYLGIVFFCFLLYRLYFFNPNVFHMSIQTMIWYFVDISVLGFLYLGLRSGTLLGDVNGFVMLFLMVFFAVMVYYAMEQSRNSSYEYLIEKHKISRIVVYTVIATITVLFVIFQQKVIFNPVRMNESFLPDVKTADFFNRYTGMILERITAPRLKLVASPFVYFFIAVASFLTSSGKMVSAFFSEIAQSC